MRYLRVRNWEEYQHYKDRTPPWIKLYHRLLDDYEYACLPDAAKGHLLGLFMLASRLDNRLPADSEWLAAKIGATDPIDLDALSHFLTECGNPSSDGHVANRERHASKPVADCEPSRAGTRSASLSVSSSVSEEGESEGEGGEKLRWRVLRIFEERFGRSVSPGGFGFLLERIEEGATFEQLVACMDHVEQSGRAVGKPNDVFTSTVWNAVHGRPVKSRRPADGILSNEDWPARESEIPDIEQEPAAAEMWSQVLKELEGQLDPQTFDTWLSPTAGASLEDGELVVAVPAAVFGEWIERKYEAAIAAALPDGVSRRYEVGTAVRREAQEAKAS